MLPLSKLLYFTTAAIDNEMIVHGFSNQILCTKTGLGRLHPSDHKSTEMCDGVYPSTRVNNVSA